MEAEKITLGLEVSYKMYDYPQRGTVAGYIFDGEMRKSKITHAVIRNRHQRFSYEFDVIPINGVEKYKEPKTFNA